ncbi:VOC family protein [bacterium]|nr:VOC family protein [bacterium]
MDLGVFSISLAVKDLKASLDFYQKLGFEILDGDGEHWQILQHESVKIGLFQGMFEKNCLTWNPTDVRSLQKNLREQGVELIQEADESTTGPAHITMLDPDGNPILFDQHND